MNQGHYECVSEGDKITNPRVSLVQRFIIPVTNTIIYVLLEFLNN